MRSSPHLFYCRLFIFLFLTMQNSRLIIESQYFPSIAWFLLAQLWGEVYMDYSENYNKRSFRNKTRITGASGVITLSAPLKKGKHQNQNIAEVKLSYAADWCANHIKTIRSVYGKSPYFIYYFDEIADLICAHEEQLVDLNYNIINYLKSTLNLDCSLLQQHDFVRNDDSKHFVMRDVIKYTGEFSRVEKEIYVVLQLLTSHVDLPFVPWPRSSILDLLFYLGPETGGYLKTASDRIELI